MFYMSTLVIAVLLVGSIIGICLILMAVASKQKIKKMNQLLNRFSELGTVYDLSFASQEVLNDSIIGLDGMNRKLMVLTQIDDLIFDDYVIDLNEVKTCTVKKHYGNIRPDELRKRKLENYLERIALHFEFKNEKAPIEVAFYNHISPVYRLDVIEQKADHWKQILSKMLNSPLKKIA